MASPSKERRLNLMPDRREDNAPMPIAFDDERRNEERVESVATEASSSNKCLRSSSFELPASFQAKSTRGSWLSAV